MKSNKYGLKNKNYISSGNLFLDKLTSGLSLGSIVLLIEDSGTDIYKSFLKYFIAEGIVNSQKILFYHNDQKLADDIITNVPYKSTQVDAILNAKKVVDSKRNTEMKIAWRYENIQYANILDDMAKNSEYIFDLSRQLQNTFLIEKNKNILSQSYLNTDGSNETLKAFNKALVKDYQSYADQFMEDEDAKFVVRAVYPNLFANEDELSEGNSASNSNSSELIKELKLNLLALKNITRSINGIVYLTVNKSHMNKHVHDLLYYFSDYVFSLKSFLIDVQSLQDYDSLFYINKLPRVCGLKNAEMETDTYGILCEKRKVVIEKIDIGVEIDRNTKVKESDVNPGGITASQAMCGSEKYTKNYEF